MGFASSAAVGGIGGLIGSLFRGPMGGSGYRGRQGSCGCSTTCGYGELQSYSYVYNFDDYCDAGGWLDCARVGGGYVQPGFRLRCACVCSSYSWGCGDSGLQSCTIARLCGL
jgi:hypothetical protein